MECCCCEEHACVFHVSCRLQPHSPTYMHTTPPPSPHTLHPTQGTAIPAAPELDTLYNLSIVRIPPNKPLARQDTPLTMFRSFPVKLKWLLMTLQGALARGQPVLLGTSSVTESELLVYYLSAPMQLGEEGEEGGGGGRWQGYVVGVGVG